MDGQPAETEVTRSPHPAPRAGHGRGAKADALDLDSGVVVELE